MAKQVVIALGITNGISHTEIKLDKQGKPRVIESCSRPAGDYIPRLIELATAENPLVIYAKQAVGDLHVDFMPATPKRYSAVQFIRPEVEGTFKSLAIPATLKNAEIIESRITALVGLQVKPGRPI